MARQKRSNQIDLAHSHTYHVVSRCTRQMHLLGSETESDAKTRKDLILNELERLATHTAVGVAGFAVMDNHIHLLLRVDPESASAWSTDDVARRWLSLHPPRNGYHHRLDVTEDAIRAFVADPDAVEAAREKLVSVSQFMKELKQEITQKINKLDDTVGSVWAGRFKCKAVTHEAQLLATLAYIDLNPFAAGVGQQPEDAKHTALASRLGYTPSKPSQDQAHADETEQAAPIKPKTSSNSAKNQQTGPKERRGWWIPVSATGNPTANSAPTLWGQGVRFSWASYLKFLDATARLLRPGKRRLDPATPPIRVRLQGLPAGQMAQWIRDWIDQGLPWAGVPARS